MNIPVDKISGRNASFAIRDLISDHSYRSIFFLLIIIPILAYIRVIRYEFIWDDIDIHIINNPYLNPPTIASISHFWTHIFQGLYIPLSHTCWAFIKILSSWLALKPDDSTLYHTANFILHTLNGLLVFTLLHKLIKNKWAAFAGTVLFLIHPMQVEPVVWVTELRGLLASFFGFSSILCYLEFCRLNTDGGKRMFVQKYYLYSFILFICALLSKPSAVVFPLFIAIFEYYLYKSPVKRIISRLWIWILPFIIITAITTSIQDNAQAMALWTRPFLFMFTITFYLYKIVLPFNQPGCYSLTPEYLSGQWWFYVIWIVPVLIFVALWLVREKYPLLMVAFLLYVSGILPVSGLIRFLYQDWSTVANRYMYISVFGTALGFAVLADWCFTQKTQWRSLVIVLLVFWLLISVMIEMPSWKNPSVFWTRVIEYSPSQSRAFYNRGLAYVRQGKNELAILDFTQAINSGYTDAYNNRGSTYILAGEYQNAVDDLTKAIKRNPGNEISYFNRGIAYLNLKKFDLSVADFNEAIKLYPKYEKAVYLRNIALSEMNPANIQKKSDTTGIKNVVANEKNNQSFYDLGNSLAQQGKYPLAIHYYTLTINQNPQLEDAYLNRGNCYSELKEYQKALQDYKKILQINPSSVTVLNNLATTYYFLGDKKRACEFWKKGSDLNDQEAIKAYKLHCK